MLCVIASHSHLYVFLVDTTHMRLSFRKVYGRSRSVFCFSILHNLLIYSGNFYMVSEQR